MLIYFDGGSVQESGSFALRHSDFLVLPRSLLQAERDLQWRCLAENQKDFSANWSEQKRNDLHKLTRHPFFGGQ